MLLPGSKKSRWYELCSCRGTLFVVGTSGSSSAWTTRRENGERSCIVLGAIFDLLSLVLQSSSIGHLL